MAARKQGRKAERDLSDRQRYWLKHLRSAERKGEALKTYATRLGLSASSMYEAKRRLRGYGLIAPARGARGPAFARVAMAEVVRAPASLRVCLASGAVLEWSEAPQGDALRELVGVLS